MCGICGVISSDPEERIDLAMLLQMRDTLEHRGPDDCGAYIGPGVGLGHRRLSIIDLRPEGRQPMSNEDGTLQIVFNGEIYNFEELRPWLLQQGHRFRSKTDTEVIVHLYEELGIKCLDRLRGMFAFALWDGRRRRLLLARDRLGKKPLFYAFDGNRLIFASEAKAILAHPSVVAEPDPQALHHYLTLGYVLSPLSAYQGISKLPPAHFLTFEDGRVEVHRYWELSYLPKLKISEAAAGEEILRRLEEAVKLRMISDVPIGAFLSGGIDSSAIVGLMSRHSAKPVKTFTIGFREQEYDETGYARQVAQRFGTEHHEFRVEPEAAADIVSELAWHYDEPYADSSAIPTYYLSKLTRRYVTVALNGDAGDENFAGYRRYSMSLLVNLLRHAPLALRRLGAKAAVGGYARLGSNRRLASRLGLTAEIIEEDWRTAYARMVALFNDAEKHELYAADFAQRDLPSSLGLILQLFGQARADNPVDGLLSVDVNSYLPDDLLVKVDRASMAVALEARSPLVDHEFMEFAARLPARMKMTLLTRKAIFKKALGKLLPDTILRRSKMGFGVPLDLWMRGGWKELLYDVLLSRRALERGYFNPQRLRHLIDAHATGKRDCQHQLWALLMLEVWHRTFIDQRLARPNWQSIECSTAKVAGVNMRNG
ncbi:MAG: asparagine synthase (glutamine-hydrolyzing) [Candidatus Binataceae bacterium]